MQKLGAGVGRGLEMGSQLYQEHQQKQESIQKYKDENETVKKLTGKDISGIRDPKLREHFVNKALEQENMLKELGAKETSNKEINRITAKALRKEKLTPEEEEKLPPNIQAGIAKFNEGPKESGGHTTKPISPEIANTIDHVINENPDASATELELQFQKSGVPKVDYTGYVESRRREEERGATTQTEKTKLALKRDDAIITTADELRQVLPLEEVSLDSMYDSLTSGDQSYFSLNNLAEKSGIELFRDAAGGQFKTGSKTFLINNVSKFGARPNQYIEQQIADSLAKVGRSRSANLMSYQLSKFESDIKKRQMEVTDDLSETDYKPGTLGKQIGKSMKSFVENKQKELEEKFKFIKKNEDKIDKCPPDAVPMISPQGKLIYVPQDRFQEFLIDGSKMI